MEEIKKKLEEKNLSDSSINAYLTILKQLNDKKEFKNLNFLKKTDIIDDIIKKKKPNTQRSYYIAICSVLDKDNKIYKHYFDKMIELNKELKEKEKENVKSDTQAKNWVEFEEIEKKRDEYEEEFKKMKNKDINIKEYLKFLLLSLYTLNAPRRNADYQHMKIIKGTPKDKENNYFSFDNKKFYFNNYKTSKHLGTQIIDIDPKLFNIIVKYLQIHPLIEGKLNSKTEADFLVKENGEKLDQVNSITYLLNSIFRGKKLGSSLLRHIYLSHKYGDVNKEQEEDAKNMGHSVSMQKDYIKN